MKRLLILTVIFGAASTAGWASVVKTSEAPLPLPAIWSLGEPKTTTYTPQAAPPILPIVPPPSMDLAPVDGTGYRRDLAFYSSDEGLKYLRRWQTRSIPYRDFIHEQLTKYHVPDEIFWLAALESGFSNTAVSNSGAVGMWQFMLNTIDGFNIRVTPYIDERRDFWKATIGAVRLIRGSYDYYGDWYLALASYNAGIPRVDWAIRRGHERNYWKLCERHLLPRETASYVPQILAIANILSQKLKYGFPLDWSTSEPWSRIRVSRPVDLRLLADAAGVSSRVLEEANPELRYPITPAGMPDYRLKVPASWTDSVRKALDDPRLKLIRYYFYKVRPGDTLSQIAQWYGVDYSVIERNNPDLRPRYLQIGQTLIIPALKDVGPYRAVHREEVASLRKVAPIPGASYTVRKGDTLYAIARRNGTTPELLASVNSMSPDSILSIGRTLLLPEGASVAR
ncbi:MAG: LysM peptidoglycan-binding domain-containing protein [Spirochaetales bacterium]|nr:LysM peptidoglycan-binding domain-containing protein [Spirochaetales bacterium]